jgi:hypothetical protein
MMDGKIKKKWVAALRSGKYKQGQAFLFRDDEYCCLGVLIDVQDPEWLKSAKAGLTLMTSSVPDQFRHGLTQGQCIELAGMNDHHESFNRIANYIEENL